MGLLSERPIGPCSQPGKRRYQGKRREDRGKRLATQPLLTLPVNSHLSLCSPVLSLPLSHCACTHIHTQTSLSLPPAPFLVLHSLIPFLVLPGECPCLVTMTTIHHDNHSPQADTSGARVHGVLQLYHPHADLLLQDNQDRGRQIEWDGWQGGRIR